jgi:hypothetical protein
MMTRITMIPAGRKLRNSAAKRSSDVLGNEFTGQHNFLFSKIIH